MITEQRRWVVDASVGIKLFVPEIYSEQAQDLFNPLNGSPSGLYVPDLFYAECGNILWKYVRRFNYPVPEAKKNMTALRSLNLKTVSSTELMENALDLALRLEITAYDACYLALAEEIKAPLVTADQKLFKRIKSGHSLLRWIGDFSKK